LAAADCEREVARVEGKEVLLVRRRGHSSEIFMAFNFEEQAAPLNVVWSGIWQKQFDSASTRWLGPGSAVPETITSGDSESRHQQPDRQEDIAVTGSAFVVFARTITSPL
jgi:hypothetical protein